MNPQPSGLDKKKKKNRRKNKPDTTINNDNDDNKKKLSADSERAGSFRRAPLKSITDI